MLQFFIGFFVGTWFGFFLIGLLDMARDERDKKR